MLIFWFICAGSGETSSVCRLLPGCLCPGFAILKIVGNHVSRRENWSSISVDLRICKWILIRYPVVPGTIHAYQSKIFAFGILIKEFTSDNFFFPNLSHEKLYRYNSGKLRVFVFQFIVIDFEKNVSFF
jgi:hypothetical protein